MILKSAWNMMVFPLTCVISPGRKKSLVNGMGFGNAPGVQYVVVARVPFRVAAPYGAPLPDREAALTDWIDYHIVSSCHM